MSARLAPFARWLPALLVASALGQPPSTEPSTESPAEPAAAPLGAPAAWEAADRPRSTLPAETELRADPSPLSPSILKLDVETEVEVLEERDGWLRVALGGSRGWVPVDPSRSTPAAPGIGLGVELERQRGVRLERARALMVDPGTLRLGAVEWWTDLHPDSRLSERLAALIGCFDRAYADRYGLDLAVYEEPDQLVVFVQEEAYRRFTADEASVAELASGGFSSIGFAALFTGARHADDVAAITAHELAHLENRRRLALELPPWLEEGLAEDQALAAAAGGGCPREGAWPELSRRRWRASGPAAGEVRTLETMSGKLRGLACTLEEWERAPPDLGELTAMGWERFSRPEGRAGRYATSALLVRFLLDGAGDDEGAARRAAFRAFLRAGRDGGGFGLGRLLEGVALDERALASALVRWGRARLAWQLGERTCS